MPKPVWLGETKELTPRGSATSAPMAMIGLFTSGSEMIKSSHGRFTRP